MSTLPPNEGNPYKSPDVSPGDGAAELAINRSDERDLTTGDWVLAVICSGIGCIMGIVYLIQGKPKAGKMIGLSILSGIIWRLVALGIQSAMQQ